MLTFCFNSVLSDLIAETNATREVMEAAEHEMHDANEQLDAAPAPPPAPVAEADLFGGWGAPAATEASAPWSAPAQAAETPAQQWGGPSAVVETVSGDDDNYGYGGAQASQPPTQQFDEQLRISSSYESDDFGVAAPSTYNDAPIAPSISREDIESAKMRALAAGSHTRETEESYRVLAAETEKLRKISEAAEADAAAKHKLASKKRMGKKKLVMEADEASMDAASKKKHFLEMQAQAGNAQALVAESRRETERLRLQAEQTELDFAAAESTKDSQPAPPVRHAGHPPAAAAAPAQYSSAIQTPSYGSEANGDPWMPDPSQLAEQSYPSYGIDQTKAAPAFANMQTYGNGMFAVDNQASEDSGGFGGGGIMGGGNGASIPAPQGNDAYASYNNPF